MLQPNAEWYAVGIDRRLGSGEKQTDVLWDHAREKLSEISRRKSQLETDCDMWYAAVANIQQLRENFRGPRNVHTINVFVDQLVQLNAIGSNEIYTVRLALTRCQCKMSYVHVIGSLVTRLCF